MVVSLSLDWLSQFPVAHIHDDRVAVNMRTSTLGFQRAFKVLLLVLLSAVTFKVKPSLVKAGLYLKDGSSDSAF